MVLDSLLPLVLGMVFFLGLIIVAIFLLVRDSRKKEFPSDGLQIQELTPRATVSVVPPAGVPASVAAAAKPNFASVPQPPASLLRIHRTALGDWEIYINGIRYTALEDVPDDAVRKQVVEATKALVNFERSYIQQQQGSLAPSATPPVVTQAATSAAPVVAPLPRYIPSPPPVTPVRGGRGPMLTIDLAKEISDVLAEMQPQVPALANRVIELKNAATGGVYFIVDNIPHNAIEDIPDPTVQQLIRAATKEWERR